MAKRSRFGCQTCKIRRVKCDETLPFCKQCTKSGRRCEGPSKNKAIFLTPVTFEPQQTPSTGGSTRPSSNAPPRQLTPVPDLQASGRRALLYFIESAGPALGGHFDQEFWHASVLQLCHRNTMVQNAVLAVSTLYEKPLTNPLSWPTTLNANFSQPEQRQAFKWYSQSLNGMSEVLHQPQNAEHLQLALTTCILFACIEFQQLSVVNSMRLLKCGYNLLGQTDNQALVRRSPIIRHVLLPIFVRQTIVLLLHGYVLPQDWLPADLKPSTDAFAPISSLQEARTQIFLIMLDGLSVVLKAYQTFDADERTHLQCMQSRILERCKRWKAQLDIYTTFLRRCSRLSPREECGISFLEIHRTITIIWLTACFESSEMIFDMFTPQFVSILDHAELILSLGAWSKISYTFEMGVIPPLMFVGWRCRIPQVRRRAIKLLERAPEQESLFHRDVDMFAVRKIIELEERLPPGVSIEDTEGVIPPEKDRLRQIMIRWDAGIEASKSTAGESRPYLVCSQWMLREDENGQVEELRPQMIPI